MYGVYAAEMVQAILMAKMAYTEFAAGFGNFEAIDDVGFLWLAVPVMSSVVAAVVQIFYAYRIKLITGSYIIPIVVVLFSLMQLGGGIAIGVQSHQARLFSQFSAKKAAIGEGIWNASSAVCDAIIAASMTYYLSRRKIIWKPAQRKVQKLVRLIIETGTLTAAIAVVSFILFELPGHPTYYQTTCAALGKMYSITMMVLLNSRMMVSRNELASTEHSSIVSNPRRTLTTSHVGITVTHEQWIDSLENVKNDTKGSRGSSDA